MPEHLKWDQTKPDGSAITWDDPLLTWDGDEPESWFNTTNIMEHNMINYELAQQAITNINGAIATIRTNLPFLLNLAPEDRLGLPHVTPASQGTLEQGAIFANANSGALPGDFDLAGFNKDLALQTVFLPLASAIAQLNEEVQDTLLALNSDLYYALLDIYAFAKASNRGGRYDTAVATLKPFFSRPRKAKTTTPTNPPP